MNKVAGLAEVGSTTEGGIGEEQLAPDALDQEPALQEKVAEPVVTEVAVEVKELPLAVMFTGPAQVAPLDPVQVRMVAAQAAAAGAGECEGDGAGAGAGDGAGTGAGATYPQLGESSWAMLCAPLE